MKGPILTERELKALPDGTRVYIVCEPANPQDGRYKGQGYVEQRDGTYVMLRVGGKNSAFATEFEFTGNDDAECRFDEEDTLEVYHYKTHKRAAKR